MAMLWVLGVVVVSAAAAIVREVIVLHRCRLRWASVERVAAAAVPGTRIVDRDAGGSIIDITITPMANRALPNALRPERPAA